MKTFNVLRIKDISVEKVMETHRIGLKGKLFSILEMNDENGDVVASIEIDTHSGICYSTNQICLNVIENFFNGRSEINHNIYRIQSEASGHLGIDKIQIEIPEPLKTGFEEIFNASKYGKGTGKLLIN